MPLFAAVSPFGLRDLVEEELTNLKVKIKKKEDRAIYFEANWLTAYKFNYTSRYAARLLYSVLDFAAYNDQDIYNNIKRHDFTKYIDPGQTVKVEAKVFHSHIFQDQRYVALKVKDALVDQFKDKYGERPNVDVEDPDLCLHVRVLKNNVSVSIDTSGSGLHERGYREEMGIAPLKENIAAAMLSLAKWDKSKRLVDPMCGSGTIAIEAAMQAANIPAGYNRAFNFARWKNFQEDDWYAEKEKIDAQIIAEPTMDIHAYDISGQMIQAAKKNAQIAGVEKWIHWGVKDAEKLSLDFAEGLIVTNPPYAKRMGVTDELIKVYQGLADSLKKNGKWDLWILSGNSDLTAALRLKAKQKIPLKNGNLDCRLLHYPIY